MNIIKALFGFLMLCAAPDSKGSVVNEWKFDKDHVKSWAEEGKKAGEFAMNVFGRAETAVKDMLLAIAQVIAGTPSVEDFLTGYATAWSNADTGKSRKTDARAVMDAMGLKDEKGQPLEIERVLEWEMTDDGKAVMVDGRPVPKVQETKTAQDWLLEYEGDFKGFLGLARELRNRSTGNSRNSQGTASGSNQGGRGKRNVTEKQLAAIMDNIPVMSANQAHTTVMEATKVIAKLPDFEIHVLNQIELLCNQLKTSKQPIFQNAATDMFDVLNSLREKLPKAPATPVKGVVQADFQVPAPAIQKTGT